MDQEQGAQGVKLSLQSSFVDNLKRFRSHSKLKKAALSIFAPQLNEDQITEVTGATIARAGGAPIADANTAGAAGATTAGATGATTAGATGAGGATAAPVVMGTIIAMLIAEAADRVVKDHYFKQAVVSSTANLSGVPLMAVTATLYFVQNAFPLVCLMGHDACKRSASRRVY